MLKPLGWASFATLVTTLLGVAFVAIMRIRINHAIRVGSDLSQAFRVTVSLAAFLEHFWWFFLPAIFGGWCVVCFTIYGIRRPSAQQA